MDILHELRVHVFMVDADAVPPQVKDVSAVKWTIDKLFPLML